MYLSLGAPAGWELCVYHLRSPYNDLTWNYHDSSYSPDENAKALRDLGTSSSLW